MAFFRSLSLIWLIFLILASGLVHFGILGSADLVDANNFFASPSGLHLFGTDSLGRDLFLRVLQGTWISLIVAICSVIISALLAVAYGFMAGWLGRQYDWAMMIILDVWMSLPSGVLATIVALLFLRESSSLILVSFVIGLTHWGRLARIVRSEVKSLKERDFVAVAKLFGGSGFHIARNHVLPHISSVIGIYVIYQLPNLVLAESFLSFIGLGVQPPNTSWGILIQDGWRSLQIFPHVVLFPAAFLSLTILSLKGLFSNRRAIS